MTLLVGVWHQGDFIVKNPTTKGLIILGRRSVYPTFDLHLFLVVVLLRLFYSSDGVLNPSGVRFGSAEIYSVMEKFSDAIDDSLCVGQRRPEDRDERVLLFLKMRSGLALSDRLKESIQSEIRNRLSPRHVPAYIFEVQDIPVQWYPSSCPVL